MANDQVTKTKAASITPGRGLKAKNAPLGTVPSLPSMRERSRILSL